MLVDRTLGIGSGAAATECGARRLVPSTMPFATSCAGRVRRGRSHALVKMRSGTDEALDGTECERAAELWTRC